MFDMNPVELLQAYGYWALLVGTFLEGETIVIIAGFLAQQGYFSPALIALCAFVGSSTSDQLMFALGRWKGLAILQRFPRLENKVRKTSHLLARYETALILGFRFIYGVRNVTPILMGISGVHYLKFVVLNLIGAAVWAVSFTAAGFFFGEMITKLMDKSPHAKYWGMAILALLFIFFWGWLRARRRRACPEGEKPDGVKAPQEKIIVIRRKPKENEDCSGG